MNNTQHKHTQHKQNSTQTMQEINNTQYKLHSA
jgi:hypothetical protein